MDKKHPILLNLLRLSLWMGFPIFVILILIQVWTAFRAWATYVGIVIFTLSLLIVTFMAARRLILQHGKDIYSFIVSVLGSLKRALIANPDVKRLVSRHKYFFLFLKNRLDKNRFLGRPSTFLAVLFLYVLFLFIGIVQDFLSSDPIVAVDIRLEHLLYAFRSQNLVKVFLWFTLLAKPTILIVFAVAVSASLWLWHKRLYILPFWVTLVGSGLTASLGKFVFHRMRPEGMIPVYLENSYSFPSGHSVGVVAFYGFLVFILWKNMKKWGIRINVLFLWLALSLAIGISRLYLGVHFLSDVLSGYLIGLLWLIIGISFLEWLIFKVKKTVPVRISSSNRIVAFALLSASFVYYIHFALSYQTPPIVPARHDQEILVKASDIPGVFMTYHLPKQTESLTGDKQEPLNFIFVTENDQALVGDLERSGWLLADKTTIGTFFTLIMAVISQKSYPTAPMTPSFWNAKVHDFGFEKTTISNSPRERHHLRVWKTGIKTEDGQIVYFGTASFDAELKWGITHRIDPNIDKERETLFTDLSRSGAIHQQLKETFVDPLYGTNFIGDPFFTDGMLYLARLN